MASMSASMERLASLRLRRGCGSASLPARRIVGFNVAAPHRASHLQQGHPIYGASSASAPSGPSTAATAAAAADTDADEASITTFHLVCPICLTTPIKVQQVEGRPRGACSCARCARTFATTSAFVDLTVGSGVEQKAYKQRFNPGVDIFRNPLVSFAYERGWRQGFAWAGAHACILSVFTCLLHAPSSPLQPTSASLHGLQASLARTQNSPRPWSTWAQPLATCLLT